jgi:hypothetical protein
VRSSCILTIAKCDEAWGIAATIAKLPGLLRRW